MPSSAYPTPARQLRSLLPDLPDARCKGRAPDFDEQTPELAAYAILTGCDLCPIIRECARVRRPTDAGGVWAGRYWVTYRGKAHPTTIDYRDVIAAAERAAADGYSSDKIAALTSETPRSRELSTIRRHRAEALAEAFALGCPS